MPALWQKLGWHLSTSGLNSLIPCANPLTPSWNLELLWLMLWLSCAGGSKLKDWDREAESDDALPEEQFDDMAGDSE